MVNKISKDILLITTLDTKEEVAEYIKDLLEEHGKSVLLLDWQYGEQKKPTRPRCEQGGNSSGWRKRLSRHIVFRSIPGRGDND